MNLADTWESAGRQAHVTCNLECFKDFDGNFEGITEDLLQSKDLALALAAR